MLSAVLFAAVFVFWTYYPHGLPLPTALTARRLRSTAAAPAAPARRPAAPGHGRATRCTDIPPGRQRLQTAPPR